MRYRWITIPVLLSAVSCGMMPTNPLAALLGPSTHRQLGPGCSLELTVYDASGASFVVSLEHQATCPATPPAMHWTDADAITYSVVWDRH